jgi:hypothetical protein
MKYFLTFAFILGFSFSVFAQNNTPEFADYPINEIYKGKNASVKIKGDDKYLKTRLQWAVKNQLPNFAGRFILTFWGCGVSCIQGAAIDAKTGKVYFLGFSVASVDNRQLYKHRLDSSLVVFHGIRREIDTDNGDHYYKFDGEKFIHIKTILTTE